MKYLIEGVKKQVSSLANQYKYLRQEDEFRIFDTAYCNIDGFDFLKTCRFTKNGDEVVFNDTDENDDTRRFKFVTNFDEAMEWCDCYCTFESIPYILSMAGDIGGAETYINMLLSHIETAKKLGKKIYLGDMFSAEFEDVIKNYDGCLNKVITKADLNEIIDFSTFYSQLNQFPTKVTMIVGTNTSAGKFSCALQTKRHYEELGEKVVLIHTEETYPFLDDQNGTVLGFCRNFSELTTDEDLVYLQCFIAKIVSEKRPDRIIFCTQAGLGIKGVSLSYQETTCGKKMKGIWDTVIVNSFGLDSVVIATTYVSIIVAEKIIRYFNIQGLPIDYLFISPVALADMDKWVKVKTDDEHYFSYINKGDSFSIQMIAQGLALRYPNIEIKCNYDDITNKVLAFKNSDYYLSSVASLYAQDLISDVMENLKAENYPLLKNAIDAKVKEYESDFEDKELFNRAVEVIKSLELQEVVEITSDKQEESDA